jgi:hypothetical protein
MRNTGNTKGRTNEVCPVVFMLPLSIPPVKSMFGRCPVWAELLMRALSAVF